MPSTPGPSVRATTGVARLVAVLAVLVGLAIMQTGPCTDQIPSVGHDSACSTTSWPMATTTIGDPLDAPSSDLIDELGAAIENLGPGELIPVDGKQPPTGLAGLCLALVVAAMLALARLIGPGLGLVSPTPSGSRRAINQHSHFALSLAVLCVMRT